MDFNNILERYSYADDKEIIERIKNSAGENERENREIINSIHERIFRLCVRANQRRRNYV